MKRTDIFDRLNNTIGNHMEGKATDQDLIKMVYEVDKYLLDNPHPHDLIKNNVVELGSASKERELLNALVYSIDKEFEAYAYLPDLIKHIKAFNCV